MDFSLRIIVFAAWWFIPTSVHARDCQLSYADGKAVSDLEWTTRIDLSSKMSPLLDTTAAGVMIYTFNTENIPSAQVNSESSMSKYFAVEAQDNKLVLRTSSEFPNIEEGLTDSTTARFSLKVTCGSSETTINIQLTIKDTNNHAPTFTESSYTFNKVPMPLPANLEVVPLLYTMNFRDLDVSSTGQYDVKLDATGAQHFTASARSTGTDKEYAVVLTTSKKLQLTETLTFSLTVVDHGTKNDSTPLNTIMDVTFDPALEDSVYEPKFEEPLYTAKILEAEGQITFDGGKNIMLTGLGTGDISCVPSDALDNSNFSSHISCSATITGENAEVTCSWKSLPDNAELLEKPYALLKLKAKQGQYEEDYTVIHLTLPGPQVTTTTSTTVTETSPPTCPTTAETETTTVCPECPTTVTVTECDCPTTFDPTTMCPTTSVTTTSTDGGPTEPPTQPEFELRSYGVMIDSPVKDVAILKPRLKEQDSSVVFSLTSDDATATKMVQMDEKTGVVTLTTYPSPGLYLYQLQATVQGTQLSDTVPFTLTVISGQLCDNSTFVFMTRYQVIKLPENQQDLIVPALTEEQDIDCVFTFESADKTNEKYFTVDSKSGNVTVKALDREEFNGAVEPALRITLNATCGDQQDSERSRTARTARDLTVQSGKAEVVDSIPNWLSSMDIVVLVQDVNDNPPVFLTTSMTVGFPVDEALQPPIVATVQATDADIGDNAEIRYSLEEDAEDNEDFWIHPTTGAIYPREGESADDEKKIQVSATDRGGLQANDKLTVVVRPLKKNNVFEMVVSGATVEDMSSVVGNLSDGTGFDVRLLSSGVVSSSRVKRAARDDESSATSIKLVLYALQGDKPVDVDVMQKKLDDLNVGWKVKQVDTSGNSSGPEDTSGYLAAVITLAVLLVLIIGGAGVVSYIYIVRPRMNNKTSDYDRFSRESKDGTESNLSSVVPTIPPLTEDLLKKTDEVPPPTSSPGALNETLTEKLYENTSNHYESPYIEAVPVDTPVAAALSDWGSSDIALPRQTEPPVTMDTSEDYLLQPPEISSPRKRSLTLYGEEELRQAFNHETSDYYEVADSVDSAENLESSEASDMADKAARRKSVVTFNENVDTIEIDRL